MSPSIAQVKPEQSLLTCRSAVWHPRPGLKPWECFEKVGSYITCKIVLRTSWTIRSSNAGIPRGLNLPLAFGMNTFLVMLILNCPETTSSLKFSNFFRVTPSIVTLSKDGVIEPLEWESLMYAAFHRSISPRSLNNLSLTN